MSVSATSLSAITSLNQASIYDQRRKDFQALASAVNSGDISQAQQALSALQSDTQSSQTTASGSAQTSQSVSPLGAQIKTDFSALTTAVQNGDLTGAQSALSNLKQDSSSASQSAGDTGQAQQTHHHHHHQSGGGDSASAASSTTSTSSSSDQTTSAVGANSTVASVLTEYTSNSTQTS